MRTIVYPGSFDPISIGHLDLIERSAKIFDNVIILVSDNLEKESMFTLSQKIEMLTIATSHLKNVKIDSTSLLLVDYLKKNDLSLVMRGLRTVTDYHYEMQMALNNKKMMPDVEIFFMVTNNSYSFISSSTIRELLKFNADLKGTVPDNILEMMKKFFNENK